MDFKPLPFQSELEQYRKQAEDLLEAHKLGDPHALELLHKNHPRFLDSKIPWLPKNLSDSEIRSIGLELSDAQLTIARYHSFQSWSALAQYVEAVTQEGSPVFQFESAVEAVVSGDVTGLESLLRAHPELTRVRSTRVTHFDPPMHRATLLHYVAANGVECYRQKTPKNIVEIAKLLLTTGAEVDALADMYGGHCTTMCMLVSSSHPAEAGVQVALVETLLDFGAATEARGSGKWASPLMTALAFGYHKAADALVRRGARVDNVAAASGLGRATEVTQFLSTADPESRHRALALAAQHGHEDIVRLLLDAGEDPNRFNPEGNHSHSTPLHQAILAGHDRVVRLLVDRGARLDMKDTVYQGTPLGWAMYAGQTEIEQYLRARGATNPESLAS
jgi:ankyrin repeat protein